jgi:hypothetical protein
LIDRLFRRTLKALALIIVLSGCAALPSAPGFVPDTGRDEPIQLKEYALVEQSIDNPTHAGFQARVPEIVAGRRAGWFFAQAEQAIAAPNEALAGFGYRLAANPSPPFSGYALYQGDALVQPDIARFWPVTIHNGEDDFLLAFETLAGERLYASLAGVQRWPGASSSLPPVYLGDQVAYASLEGSQVSVMAGPGLLYTGPAAAGPRNLTTWGDHWALELDGQVIVDGQDFNQQRGYDEVFHWQAIGGAPFFFYVKDSLVYLNYAGRDLPYYYDQVIHDQPGELAMYNPGSAGDLVWFYALRDGLWYYVEAGKIGE